MAPHQQKPKIPFRERVYRFMLGRNGTDTLCTTLTVAAFILLLIELISGWVWLSIPSLALLIYSNFRAFSRNVAKRRRENAAFCGFFRRIRGFFKLQKNTAIVHRERYGFSGTHPIEYSLAQYNAADYEITISQKR